MSQDRTLIQIPKNQSDALKAMAERRGIAPWKLIDEIIGDYLAKHCEWGK